MDRGVVGVDLCGDPSKGNIVDILAFINAVKQDTSGIKLTVHLGELACQSGECIEIMELGGMHRLSHCTFIDSVKEKVMENKIPIEICMTSNVLCKTVEYYESHHLKELIKLKHPVVLCVR